MVISTMCNPVRGRGFTLIELIVTLSVFGILTALAVPSFSSLVAASRVREAGSDLLESVFLARSEAVKRAANVDVVPTSGNWQNGWTVQTGTTVLQSRAAVSGATTITPNAGGNITFQLSGRVSTPIRTLTVSAAESSSTRCISIDASGRASIRLSGNGCS